MIKGGAFAPPLNLALLWRVAFDPPRQPFAYALRQPTLPETSVREGKSEDKIKSRALCASLKLALLNNFA